MGEFTLKELCKLRRAYFKKSTMEAYFDWKGNILRLFCSVHDLDTLARIIRRKRCKWQEIKDISHAALINGILIIAIKFMLNDFTKVAANLSLAANIIFCACMIFVIVSSILIGTDCNSSISFYEECLGIVDYLDKCSTK